MIADRSMLLFIVVLLTALGAPFGWIVPRLAGGSLLARELFIPIESCIEVAGGFDARSFCRRDLSFSMSLLKLLLARPLLASVFGGSRF